MQYSTLVSHPCALLIFWRKIAIGRSMKKHVAIFIIVITNYDMTVLTNMSD